MNNPKPLDLRAGDLVTIRSRKEILATLDRNGDLNGLPFMPEMLALAGKKAVVYKRADKTCDTIDNKGAFRMHDTVHLNGLRCDGSAHGGCEAGCLLFFKEEWLQRDEENGSSTTAPAVATSSNAGATEADLERACLQPNSPNAEGKPLYRCQATQLKDASEPLEPTDVRQYVRDVVTRNAPLGQMIAGFAFAAYRKFMHMGRGHRAKVAFFNFWQRLHGGIPFPWVQGTAEKTPTVDLHLQSGDWVRVKSFDEIIATLDKGNKNRGLWFDTEMVKFCGGTYRVDRKVARIIHEKHHYMLEFKTQPIILRDVFCCGDISEMRLFCPRAIHIYWRDIWLERVNGPAPAR